MRIPNLVDHLGRPITLGPELGKGGEGTVFDLVNRPNEVAKVYNKTCTPQEAAKLKVVIGHARKELHEHAAWPTCTLHEGHGGPTRGVVMPRVKGFKEVHFLYSPAHRKTTFPRADWRFLIHVAMNCAAAFDTVHGFGVVIGDVNQSNVLVSESGRVALIDCDSYQVRSSGYTYPCNVGVDLFTPPELQGQSFRGLVRQPNHDRFGMAVLIFYLLFMNRHPFAGRYIGHGDMPIDRAIKEYRFAYSRSAAIFQMQTPMHALPLSAVSPELVQLFERAFGRGSDQANARPTAGEWQNELKTFLGSLRACPSDPGHVYAPHLPQCPWHALMQQGAPNFFVTVAYFRAAASSAGVLFDLSVVWTRIENVPRPDSTYIPPAAIAAAATPWPARLPKKLPVKPDAPEFDFLLWLKSWWSHDAAQELKQAEQRFSLVQERWRETVKAVEAEVRRRQQALDEAEQRATAAQRNWTEAANRFSYQFHCKKDELIRLKDSLTKLAAAYAAEQQQLQADARQMQLSLFLQQKFISDHKISDIGQARKDMLASYGIETADDIVRDAILRVPGFKDKLTARLVQWRQRIEAQFVFNATAGVPAQQRQTTDLKYSQARQQFEAALLSGEKELRAITAGAENTLRQLYEHIKRATQQVVQARGDAADIPPELWSLRRST